MQSVTPRGSTFSLRSILVATTLVGLVVAQVVTVDRLRRTRTELTQLRRRVGYLAAEPADRAAAVRAPSDQPLTYRFRVRVPQPLDKWANRSTTPRYRLVYSTVIAKDEATPRWFGGLAVTPGQSDVTVRIAADTRDGRWKVSLVVRGESGTRRIGSALPADQVAIFRASHDVVSTGIGATTEAVGDSGRLRLLDDRWLSGEGGALLYGNRPVKSDQIGVYVQLQRSGVGAAGVADRL